jgi:hypothetical protein
MAFHFYPVLVLSIDGFQFMFSYTPDNITRIYMQISHLVVITELVEV